MGNLVSLKRHPNLKNTGLLLASWIGNENIVKYILDLNAFVNAEDNSGRYNKIPLKV